ncbi:hypothetical protein ACFFX0_27740 [Citricoccus parietis]|uniref:Uncharacterized protein n=1 Tax=Citricoccus parietis TaxID=592307 RepID=A0ABV5G748_9MICC
MHRRGQDNSRVPFRQRRLVLLGGHAGDHRVTVVEDHALSGHVELTFPLGHPRFPIQRDVDGDFVVGGPVHLGEQVAVGL